MSFGCADPLGCCPTNPDDSAVTKTYAAPRAKPLPGIASKYSRVLEMSQVVWDWVLPWLLLPRRPRGHLPPHLAAFNRREALTLCAVGEGVFPLVPRVCSLVLTPLRLHYHAVRAAAEAGATSCLRWLIRRHHHHHRCADGKLLPPPPPTTTDDDDDFGEIVSSSTAGVEYDEYEIDDDEDDEEDDDVNDKGDAEWVVGLRARRMRRREEKDFVHVIVGLCSGGHLALVRSLFVDDDGDGDEGHDRDCKCECECGCEEGEVVRTKFTGFGRGLGLVGWKSGDVELSEHVRDTCVLRTVCERGYGDVARWIIHRFKIRDPWEIVSPFLDAIGMGHLDLAKWLVNKFDLATRFKRYSDHWLPLSVILRNARRSYNLEVIRWCLDLFPLENNTDIDDPVWELFASCLQGRSANSLELCKYIKERLSFAWPSPGSVVPGIPREDVRMWVISLLPEHNLSDFGAILEQLSVSTPEPVTFLSACRKGDSLLAKSLLSTMELSTKDILEYFMTSLTHSNTFTASWLDSTFNILGPATPEDIGWILVAICKGMSRFSTKGEEGVVWLLSRPSIQVGEIFLVEAAKNLIKSAKPKLALLIVEKFRISEPKKSKLLIKILRVIPLSTISQLNRIISLCGELTNDSIGKCLLENSFYPPKVLKWMTSHLQFDREQIKSVLSKLIHRGQESCAEWLINKFHVTLDEVLSSDPVGYDDFFTWKMLLQVFPGITASIIKEKLLPFVVSSPIIAQHTMRKFPDVTEDEIIEFSRGTSTRVYSFLRWVLDNHPDLVGQLY